MQIHLLSLSLPAMNKKARDADGTEQADVDSNLKAEEDARRG